MAELNMEKAKNVYKTLCNSLDNRNWNYTKIEDKLLIKTGVKGNKFPIQFVVKVNPQKEIVSSIALLDFKISKERLLDFTTAICVANNTLANGSFDFDISDGSIMFRIVSSYKDSILGEELFKYMINVSGATINAYSDRFYMLNNGLMSVQQFIDSEQNP